MVELSCLKMRSDFLRLAPLRLTRSRLGAFCIRDFSRIDSTRAPLIRPLLVLTFSGHGENRNRRRFPTVRLESRCPGVAGWVDGTLG